MFKLIGMIVGAGLILFTGIAWLDAPQAKKVSSQLHSEINQVIDQVAQSSDFKNTIENQIDVLPAAVDKLVDRVETTLKQVDVEHQVDESLLPIVVEETNLPWHIFWQPFRSLPSAKGFARRLTQQTGIPVTVIINESGQHRVNFSYTDEADKQRILLLIQEKTGLEVSAS